MSDPPRPSADLCRSQRPILGIRIDTSSYGEATTRVLKWSQTRESRYLCAANVHMVMEANDAADFAGVVNGADLVVPDGMPLVWGLRMLGVTAQQRVYGPTLTLHVCEAAAREGIPIGLFGGTEESLDAFCSFLQKRFPEITIVCRIAPPFRPVTEAEDAAYTQEISGSGARILFVGLGCPKQERWMAEHKGRIPAVMLGVGAAFGCHSGRIRQAPAWLQRAGLEWLFRLTMEPRRLWKRYCKHNPRFVLLFCIQFLKAKTGLNTGQIK